MSDKVDKEATPTEVTAPHVATELTAEQRRAGLERRYLVAVQAARRKRFIPRVQPDAPRRSWAQRPAADATDPAVPDHYEPPVDVPSAGDLLRRFREVNGDIDALCEGLKLPPGTADLIRKGQRELEEGRDIKGVMREVMASVMPKDVELPREAEAAMETDTEEASQRIKSLMAAMNPARRPDGAPEEHD